MQTTLEATISGLTRGTQYAIIVVTINSAGLMRANSIVKQRTSQYVKLGSDGQPLANQDGTWIKTGEESEGTNWSCVLDNLDTADDSYWEIKTDDGEPR